MTGLADKPLVSRDWTDTVTHAPGTPCLRGRAIHDTEATDPSEVDCVMCLRLPLAEPGRSIGDDVLFTRGDCYWLVRIHGLNPDGSPHMWLNGARHLDDCPADHAPEEESDGPDSGW